MFGDRYTPHDPRLVRIYRFLSASFRLGRFFGVEVRIYWLTLLVLPLLSVVGAVSIGSGGSWGWALGVGLLFDVALLFVIYTHEMSHIAAGWRYGIRTSLITLSPLGGIAHMDAPAPNPRADLVISLAGPAVHLVWMALLAPLHFFALDYLLSSSAWWLWLVVEVLWSLNLGLMLFNLLPFYPMDGGRALRSLLAFKMHPNRATIIAARVGMVGAVLLGLGALFWTGLWGSILLFIAISNFMACSRAVVAARHQSSPYGTGPATAPWEADPEAWKSGGGQGFPGPGAPSSGPRKPGRLRAWLDRRRRESEADLEAEMDRILAKISQVGMGGLTRTERRTLQRGSKAARNKRR